MTSAERWLDYQGICKARIHCIIITTDTFTIKLGVFIQTPNQHYQATGKHYSYMHHGDDSVHASVHASVDGSILESEEGRDLNVNKQYDALHEWPLKVTRNNGVLHTGLRLRKRGESP